MKSLSPIDLTRIKLAVITFINGILPFFIAKRLPLSAMVNQERVRSSIKRIFRNSVKEVLGELFQNSQRAGARLITITTSAKSFTIADDGTGLDGINGFHALLKIAESHYEAEEVESDQKPMGLGINSLISFSGVSRITFSSGRLELEIDTSRWFEDERYYTTWFRRLKSLKEPVRGLKITVECSEKMVKEVREALKAQDRHPHASPAQGYEGILEIELDGRPVETRLPRWAKITTVLVDTNYLGSRLQIGFTDDDSSTYKCSTVCWYGQLIPFDFSTAFRVHLSVRHGHPVQPRSPAREGLIENESYEQLISFAKNALFEYLFAPENRSRIHPSWVAAYYKLDMERAVREAPYYIASPRNSIGNPDSYEDIDTKGDPAIFAYSDEEQPLLLQGSVILLIGDEEEEVDNGISSFIPQIGPAYALEYGDSRRLSIGRLYWRPGKHLRYFFYEPGEYGISFSDELPETFSPVTEDDCFIYSSTANWDPEDAEFVATTSDMISFLNIYSWSAFSYDHDEASYDELRDAYQEAINRMIREIVGNCVSYSFSLNDLKPFFSEKNSRVETIQVRYDENNTGPKGLVVTNNLGETVNLSLMY